MIKNNKLAVQDECNNVTISKSKFTASDLKNDLYALAKAATQKNSDPRKINSAISGYRAILSTIGMEIKAAKIGLDITGS